MTYCGMQLPAGIRHVAIGRFERVIADIGDEQSIAANASTFSAHLERMREMLDRRRTSARWCSSTRSAAARSPARVPRWRSRMLERLLQVGARATS